MIRLDPADAERALAEPEGTASDADLAAWVEAAATHAASLPPKPKK